MRTRTNALQHLAALVLALPSAASSQGLGLHGLLAEPILTSNQTEIEAKVFTSSRVPAVRIPASKEEWQETAARIRGQVLDEIVFRGEARAWRESVTRVEWMGSVGAGEGYSLKKLRYEAIPGLWIPALLYEPDSLDGAAPVVINVNGHDRSDGKAADYKQIRCINLAKRGVLALNLEWIGMGQLNTPGFGHYKINQLDLVGTSGVALHYLALSRAIDLMLDHQNADPSRVAVTGLSGGGWQTILISALDERVALANPVAGYSSFVTRAQFPGLDLGDSEQTPSDLAAVADYTHLTALRAPRLTLLTNNAHDTCCFRAEYALGPLLRAAKPAFGLHGKSGNLRHHVNQDPGHNYGQDNREAFYGFLGDAFFEGAQDFDAAEIDVIGELKSGEQLHVPLPENNLDIRQIAQGLARDAPPRPRRTTADLQAITKMPRYQVRGKLAGNSTSASVRATRWRLRMDNDWTVPAVELEGPAPGATAILVADGGRDSTVGAVRAQLALGKRVLAVDPYYFGESRIATKDWLWSLLIASLGERPLGIQAGQIAAAARWAKQRHGEAVELHAIGPRTSLAALVAAALEPGAVSGVRLVESFRSLAEIIERDIDARQAPELFCFGLLEAFEMDGIRELVAPRPVELVSQ
ncbi:MAG: acetylxylan esterase [Bryobacterales bacterium]|nr:acetylxylan esterase [Bryobacterales bacterium]